MLPHYNNVRHIAIVISKLLKRHSKAKRKAPAYSRALHHDATLVNKLVPCSWRLINPLTMGRVC